VKEAITGVKATPLAFTSEEWELAEVERENFVPGKRDPERTSLRKFIPDADEPPTRRIVIEIRYSHVTFSLMTAIEGFRYNQRNACAYDSDQ